MTTIHITDKDIKRICAGLTNRATAHSNIALMSRDIGKDNAAERMQAEADSHTDLVKQIRSAQRSQRAAS